MTAQLEAYLGRRRPNTLATGPGHPDHIAAIVWQDTRDGSVQWGESHPNRFDAMDALDAMAYWPAHTFPIVCRARVAGTWRND